MPPALLGRAFARFETQLQLVWVLCGLLAVVVGFSLQAGDILLGVTCAVAAGFHVSMRRAVLPSHGTPRAGPGRPAGRLAQLTAAGRRARQLSGRVVIRSRAGRRSPV